jgi:hypothetical protein
MSLKALMDERLTWGRASVGAGRSDHRAVAFEDALRALDEDGRDGRPPSHNALADAITAASGDPERAATRILVRRSASANPELADLLVARLTAEGFELTSLLDPTSEQVRFRYGPLIGEHAAFKSWVDADARIIVGEAAADRQLLFAGTIAAALGCVPETGALAARIVSARGIAQAAVEILERLPVAFGVLGATTRQPRFAVIASSDLLAIDWVLGEVLGINGPELSPAVAAMLESREPLELDRVGDLTEWDVSRWDPQLVGPARAALADLGAGHFYGRLLGAREVPWTSR